MSQPDLTSMWDTIGAAITIIDVAPAGCFIVRALNKAAKEYYGLIQKQVAGREITNFAGISEQGVRQRKRAIKNYHRCIAARQPVFSETRQDFADGSFRWGRHTFVPIFADDGEVHQIMVTSIDISELKESQKELKTIMDTIGEPIMILDVMPGERFTFSILNRAAEQYFSVSNDVYSGMELANFEGLDATRITQRKQSIAVSKRCIATRAPVLSETKHLRRDGSYRWGRNTNAPIFNSNGEVHQIMVTSVDITELKETQDRLESALTRVLSGFVTICAMCKDIKEDSNQWVRVEHYLDNEAHDVKFSHGYCPKCYESAIRELR